MRAGFPVQSREGGRALLVRALRGRVWEPSQGSQFNDPLKRFAALGARQDAELLAVLGHRPAGDLDVLVLEQLDDALIRMRALRALGADDLLDLELDGLRCQIVAIGA